MEAAAATAIVNDVPAVLLRGVEAVLEDPRLRQACPGCDPLPRDWPEACKVLSLEPPVLPWYLSAGQMPDKFLGNYLSNAFLSHAVAHALGVPFVVVTTHVEREMFKHFLPWFLSLFKRLPGLPARRASAAARAEARAACRRCGRSLFPHECAYTNALWEESAGPFAALLLQGLNETVLPGWARKGARLRPGGARGWPGDVQDSLPRGSRAVAAHVRCGDALAQGGEEWGLLPIAAYARALLPGDVVALVSASLRGADLPFAVTCREVLLGLQGMLAVEFLVSVVSFFDENIGHDLARLAFAEVVMCGPSSTFCLWAALAATAHGAEAHIPVGPLLMNGSRPAIPGIRWFQPPRLAKGWEPEVLLARISSTSAGPAAATGAL